MLDQLVIMSTAPLEAVADWLAAFGLDVCWDPGHTQITWRNPWLETTGCLPATLAHMERAPILGFALAGQYWPQVFPGLLDAVQKRRPTS